jgi:glycosyltransferase involved in cell wall biosynthesis
VPAVLNDRVALVIPARDEARHLPRVLAQIPDWVSDVVLVDDGSRDGTWDVIEEWSDARAQRVRHRAGRGVGAAIVSGYARALACGAGVVAVVGADDQMHLGELARVVGPVREGRADYVQGSRFGASGVRGRMPLLRIAGNRTLSAASSWAAGRRVSDSQCGFTAAGARLLSRLRLERLPAGYGFPAFVRLEAHRHGARVVEVPVTARYADEVSGIDPLLDPPRICARILWLGVRRRLARWRSVPGAAPALGRAETA